MMPNEDGLSRRAYLRIASGAGVGMFSGCSALARNTPETTRATEATTRNKTTEVRKTTIESVDENRFETVVNIADAGADTSGETPINSVLDEHVGDDTLLYFPSGRYRLKTWELTDYRNIGIIGENAVLVPPDGEQNYWLIWKHLQDVLFAGFTLDGRAKSTAPVTYLSISGGTNVVRNVLVRGHRQVPRSGFEIAVMNPDAHLKFENVSLPDGSIGGNGIYVFPKSVGGLTFKDCRIEHWAEGLYGSYHSGPLEVSGGYYANNGIDQVRVGGGTAGAVVRDVTVRVDNPKQPKHKPNMRGIWAEEGSNVGIENCDIAFTDLTGTYSDGAIVVGTQFGEVTVEDTQIRTDAAAPAITIRPPIDSMEDEWMPSMNSLPENWRFAGRNIQITGAATEGTTVRVNSRNDCLFEKVCIQHPDGSRDGISVSHVTECTIQNSTINVSGDAISTTDATVITDNLRTDGSC